MPGKPSRSLAGGETALPAGLPAKPSTRHICDPLPPSKPRLESPRRVPRIRFAPDYQCMREAIDSAGPRCQVIPGAPGRRRPRPAAAGQALTPLSLEVALTVQAEIEARAAEADAIRASHVERARHRADPARRRYLAVDPGNRLVARIKTGLSRI